MASSGIVKQISGIVTDGTGRILQVGDVVLPNDQILTGDTGAISIEFSDGKNLDLGRNSDVTLNDATLNADAEANQAEQTITDAQDEVDAIQQALLNDEAFDPNELDAPAAGAPTEENAGSSIVQVDYLNPATTPVNAFETTGIEVDFPEQPDEQLIQNLDAATDA
ncbi:MAG: retention module-containing protein, partial [Methyloprofundus sp.]|nr:retention module-containing protein [Methyloprofundus sp.]